MADDRGTVHRFLVAYNESVEMVNGDPWAFDLTLQDRLRFPKELVGSFDFPPLSPIQLPSEEDLQRVQAWMQEIGMLSDMFSYENVMAVGLYG